MKINKSVRETQMLLALARRTIQPAGIRLATLADLADHVATAGLDITTEINPRVNHRHALSRSYGGLGT